MPGMFNPLFMAGGSAKAIAYRDYAQSATASVTLPATIQTGDIIVLIDTARNSATGKPTKVVPSGFTEITTNEGSAYHREVFSFKLAVASDAGKSVAGMSGTQAMRKLVAVFSASAVSSSASASIDITSSTAAPIVIVAAFSANSSDTIARNKIKIYFDAETSIDRIENFAANTGPSQYIAWVIANTGLQRLIRARADDSGLNNAASLVAIGVM